MKAWEEYAFVVDGVVQNVGVFAVGGYTEANIVAREVYGEGTLAINVSQIPTAMGDTYRDGVFYRKDEEGNEKEVPTIPTEEQAVDTLNQTTAELQTSTESNTTSIESNTTAIDDILVMLLDDTSATDDLSGLEDTTDTSTETA